VVAELSEADRAVLELAARAARTGLRPGQMENLIRDLGMGEIAYYARLRRLLETQEALAAFPGSVPRLRRTYLARAGHRLGSRKIDL